MSECPQCGVELEDPELCTICHDELSPGTMLGSYRVLDLLGEGGMGRVYLAEHVRLGRQVAIKVLRRRFATNTIAVARFFAEARAVNQISHENLVEITDFFENQGGDNYFIMELLKGEDLAQALLAAGVFPVLRALDVATQLTNVLDAVHAARIVHRDLKPENIFLIHRHNNPDFVKVVDFGVAKLMAADGVKIGTTAAGTIIGTPEYMSPEQAGGDDIDHRTDIYALGIILYELVTGTVPFRARTFGEMVIKHMTLEPQRLNAHATLPHVIPDSLEELIFDLLAKEPERRPQTMKEVERRLREIHDELAPPLEVEEIPSGGVRIRATPRAITARPSSEPKITGREATIEADRVTTGQQPAHDERTDQPTDGPAARATVEQIRPGRTWRLVAIGALIPSAAILVWIGSGNGSSNAASEVVEAVPAPKPRPTIPAPAEITIEFSSKPAGAVVHAQNSRVMLGTTPFARKFPREEREVIYEFELLGHTHTSRSVSMANGGTASVELSELPVAVKMEKPAPAKPKPQPTKPRPKSALDRGATMNVFE